MKQFVTMPLVKTYYSNLFKVPYCALQNLFLGKEPKFYNYGTYGWNCDIYTSELYNVAITTGYRNTKGKKIPTEIVEKYETAAKKIISENTDFYDINLNLRILRQKFFQELTTLND